MKVRTLAILFLLMLLIAILARAPASALAPVLANHSANRLQLTEARGSVWSGSTGLSCILPEGTSVNCGRWAWNLVPESLAQARLSLLVRREGVEESMLISWSPDGLEMERVAITLPAALAGSIDPKIAALRLGGSLDISSQQLSSKAGHAKISWQKMESGLLPDQPLGDHAIHIAIGTTGSSFTITSSPGPVVLTGGGAVAPNGRTTIDIVATVGSRNTALSSLLSLMGQEVTPGQFRLKLP